MKKTILFLTLTSLLFSQDVEDGEIEDSPATFSEAILPPSPPPKKNSIEQRNWIFAAGSAAAAAIAIGIVWINPGKGPPSKE